MFYLTSSAKYPINFISCGNLVSEKSFIHPKRNIDSFVLIVVLKGTLFVEQDKRKYSICENEFIILFKNTNHLGFKESFGYLSYYWVHFDIKASSYKYFNDKTIRNYFEFWNAGPEKDLNLNHYVLPEHGILSKDKCSILLFTQLLDLSRRERFAHTFRCHYALSLLLLEVSEEALNQNQFFTQEIPCNVVEIIEWIRANYNQCLTVRSVADKFNYNPTYLSGLFKQYTHYPLSQYINRVRVTVAKNILMANRNLTIYNIARASGFDDEKYFMKVFKKIEGLTPSQYREAFYMKKINKP